MAHSVITPAFYLAYSSQHPRTGPTSANMQQTRPSTYRPGIAVTPLRWTGYPSSIEERPPHPPKIGAVPVPPGEAGDSHLRQVQLGAVLRTNHLWVPDAWATSPRMPLHLLLNVVIDRLHCHGLTPATSPHARFAARSPLSTGGSARTSCNLPRSYTPSRAGACALGRGPRRRRSTAGLLTGPGATRQLVDGPARTRPLAASDPRSAGPDSAAAATNSSLRKVSRRPRARVSRQYGSPTRRCRRRAPLRAARRAGFSVGVEPSDTAAAHRARRELCGAAGHRWRRARTSRSALHAPVASRTRRPVPVAATLDYSYPHALAHGSSERPGCSPWLGDNLVLVHEAVRSCGQSVGEPRQPDVRFGRSCAASATSFVRRLLEQRSRLFCFWGVDAAALRGQVDDPWPDLTDHHQQQRRPQSAGSSLHSSTRDEMGSNSVPTDSNTPIR